VVFRRGKQINDRHDRVDQAEDFLQSIIGKQSILTVPVSMMCNAAAVDGATLLRWDSRVERFGVIVNTAKRRSVSEGARTRAAEFLSAYGVAIKISEDGQITLFGAGKELTAID